MLHWEMRGRAHDPAQNMKRLLKIAEWAPGVCRTLCAAISDYLRTRRSNQRYYAADGLGCSACKRTLFKEHPDHTRREGECRFPKVASMELKCQLCLAGNRPNDHPGHTKVDGECRMALAATNPPVQRRSAPRVRGYTPDTPKAVAHKDPAGNLPPTAPAPDAVEAEPAPPPETASEETSGTATASSSSSRPAGPAAGHDYPHPTIDVHDQRQETELGN